MSVRDSATPAACRAAVMEASGRVTTPSLPAFSKAPATMSAHWASWPFAASHAERALMTPEASRVAHEQDEAKLEHHVVSDPGRDESWSSAPRVEVAKLRR